MANISTYLADKLLDHSLGTTAYTMPTVWCALFTTDPTMPAGTGAVEVSGGSYARVQVSTHMTAASAGSTDNSAILTWPTATAAWGTILGLGLYDASTVGNLLAAGPLATSKVVGSGDTFSIPTSDLAVTLG